jgi:hypothetical protein
MSSDAIEVSGEVPATPDRVYEAFVDPGLHAAMTGAADYSFVGENSRDNAGHSVSGAGDVDGDGLDDLLVGASGNADGGSRAGKAYLILSGL